jgi:hypothetical protein
MPTSASELANYLGEYVETYRREYERFTSSPPNGGGYPDLKISPYLYSDQLQVYVATNGVAIADFSYQPDYRWDLAGGPALIVDYPETRRPPEIHDFLEREGLLDENIGHYRLVGKIAEEGIPDDVWYGRLGQTLTEIEKEVNGFSIWVREYDLSLESLLKRLTFGAFCYVLDIKLRSYEEDFWMPHITRDLGFMTADRESKRFFHYLELHPHRNSAAWDERNIRVRVRADVRRDFGAAIAGSGENGATLSFGERRNWPEHYHDRLSALGKAIDDFETLLRDKPDAEEKVFHNFLEDYPELVDVYGEAVSKPRFYYPEGESPLGKNYVEPDFIIRYARNSYKLVELERPSKKMATQQGQPRSEVTQASFQVAEWKAYIKNHYDQLRRRFPGISVNHSTLLVISRTTERSFGSERKVGKYMELVKEQFDVDEVVTYDDLLSRARSAYIRLSSLAISE